MVNLLAQGAMLAEGAADSPRAAAAFFFQDGGMFGADDRTFFIFMGLVVFALMVQAVVLIAMAVGGARMQKQILDIANDMRGRINPVLASSRAILEDTAPKMKVISANLVEVSATLRDKTHVVGNAVEEITERTRRQAVRADGMVTDSLNAVEQVAASVQQGVMVPIRQFQGVLNGLRAGLDVLAGKRPMERRGGDDDMFV